MNTNNKAHLFIFGANVIYGVNYLIAKLALTTIPAFALVLTRVSIPLVFFWAVSYFYEKGKVERKDHFALFYCGLFGVAANQLMFIKGLDMTSEIHASLIMITTPILVLVMSWFILKDRLTWKKTIGVLIGAAGVWLLVKGNAGSDSTATIAGDLLIMGNAASYALFLVLAKPLMNKYPPFTVTFWLFLYGLVFVLPFGLTEIGAVPWQELHGKVLWSWLFVVFISTLVVYMFNIMGLKFGSPALVSIYIYTQPLLATLLAVLLGSDKLTWNLVVAALLIFPGVALVTMGSSNGKQTERIE